MPFLLVALLIVHVASSASNTSAVDKLRQAQQKLKVGADPECADCRVTQAGTEEPAWKQCLQQLCPEGYGGIQKELSRAAKSVGTKPDPDFMEVLDDLARQLIATKLKAVTELRRAIATDRRLTNPAARRLLRFQRLVEPGVPVSKAMSPELVAVIKALKRSDEENPLEDLYGTVSQTKNPAEIATLVAKGRRRLEELNRRVQDKTGVRDFENEMVLRETMKPVSAERYDRLRGNLRGTRLNELIIEAEALDKPGRVSIRETFGPDDERLARTETLLKSYASDEIVIKNDPVGRSLMVGLKNCTAAFYTNRQFAPTPEQVAAFRKSLPARRDRFVANLKPHMSTESSGKLGEAAGAWKFDVPPDAATQKENFLASMYQTTKLNADFLEDKPDGAGTNGDYLLVNRYLADKDPGVAAGVELANACGKFTTAPVRDSFTPGTERVEVGPYSMTHEEFGASVLTHELGHAASELFAKGVMSAHSKEWYDETRRCLGAVPGHDRLVEEDWADHLLKFGAVGNFACHILRDGPAGFTVDANAKSTHSSDLYRTLVVNHALGRPTPKVCTEALRARGESFEPSCPATPKATAEAQ